MHFEAVKKMVRALLGVLVLSGTAGQAQSICIFPPVDYTVMGSDAEPAEGIWRITEARDAYDMRLVSEPLRHFVILDEPGADLAETAPAAPAGEFPIHDGQRWWLSHEYEAVQVKRCQSM